MATRKGLYTVIKVDDSDDGTPADISAQVISTEGLPLTYDELEAGGFGTVAKTYASGRADVPVVLEGRWDSTLHGYFNGWAGVDTDVRTVEFEYGDNAAPTTGDPQIDGEYGCSEYSVFTGIDDFQRFRLKLYLASGSALPAWGTKA